MRPVRDWTYRLYKVSLPSALVLVMPMVAGVAWYAWSAFAQYDRYARAFDEPQPLDTEMFQLYLYDELHRDLRRLLLPARPADSPLPTYELSLGRDALDQLNATAGTDKQEYVDGYLRAEGAMHDVTVRPRGSRHWHWLGKQKSLKVRTKRGDLVEGVRVFNLLNDVTPFGMEEELILDLAREHGLLTPEYRPVWLRLNNSDLGVYRYAAQPAEGLLRRGNRMPGSVYSGNSDDASAPSGAGALWSRRRYWAKSAAKSPQEEEEFGELERLLDAVNTSSYLAFRDWARDRLDLDRFATFDALDVVFGGDQHDFLANHKLYFDPYRGRFEPIAWSFRGFTHDPVFNRVDNPLLLRLKALPEYLPLRDRKVYELLVGEAAVPEIRARVDRRYAELLGDLEADPYWDAYKLLPRASRFHRFMVRPMSAGRWLLAGRAELVEYARRSRFLLEVLEQPSLTATFAPDAAGRYRLELTVDGYGAYRLERLTLQADCAGTYTLFSDTDLNRRYEPGRDSRVAAGVLGEAAAVVSHSRLLPGIRLDRRDDAQPKRGAVKAVREPRVYRYFVTTSACAPTGGSVEVASLVTGASERLRFRLVETASSSPLAATPVTALPRLVAEERSPHPWSYGLESPEPVEISLGPGLVAIDETRTFERFQAVRIAAGTEIRIAAGASLVFKGPVYAEGTASAPVVIGSQSATPFAGLLLIGPDTAGSKLRHVEIRGGTRPKLDVLYTPSLLNIYDTAAVSLEHVSFSGATKVDDVLHATYVDGLQLHDVQVLDAPNDAIDIEMSRAEIRGGRVIRPGDECLDLMGSTVRLADAVFIGCKNNAISAGELSDLTVHGSVIADTKVAILSKNASTVRLSRSLIYRAERALRTNRRDVYYDRPSFIGAQGLFAVDCDGVTRVAKQTSIETGVVHRTLPENGMLDHVRRQVLELDDWQELDRRLDELSREAAP